MGLSCKRNKNTGQVNSYMEGREIEMESDEEVELSSSFEERGRERDEDEEDEWGDLPNQRARVEVYVKDKLVFLHGIPIPLEGILSHKPLVESLLLKSDAKTVLSFEKLTRGTRQFVRRWNIWLRLFKRDFPIQFEHNFEEENIVSYNDGETFDVQMKAATMDFLDAHSQHDHNVFTYWKRFYELLYKAKLKNGLVTKLQGAYFADLDRFDFLNAFEIYFNIALTSFELFEAKSGSDDAVFYVVGQTNEGPYKMMRAFGMRNYVKREEWVETHKAGYQLKSDWVPYNTDLLHGPLQKFTISPSGRFVLRKDVNNRVRIVLTHLWVADFKWKGVSPNPFRGPFLVSCSACDKDLASGYHQFDGHEEHKFCSEDCANDWWDSQTDS